MQEVRGVGFQPAAVIAWWTRQDGDGIVLGNRGGMGFWAAGSACAALAWASDDGVIPTRTSRVHDATALLGLDRAGDGVAMRAELASLDPDGFTLEWGLPPSAPWTVHYLALGGPAVTAARVGWIPSPISPGRQTVPLDGIEPDLVLFLPATGPRRGSPVEGLSLGIGAVAGKRQAAAGFVSRNGADAGDVGVLSEPTPRSWPSPTARSSRGSAESRSPGRMRWRSTGPRPPRSRARFRISPSRVSAPESGRTSPRPSLARGQRAASASDPTLSCCSPGGFTPPPSRPTSAGSAWAARPRRPRAAAPPGTTGTPMPARRTPMSARRHGMRSSSRTRRRGECTPPPRFARSTTTASRSTGTPPTGSGARSSSWRSPAGPVAPR